MWAHAHPGACDGKKGPLFHGRVAVQPALPQSMQSTTKPLAAFHVLSHHRVLLPPLLLSMPKRHSNHSLGLGRVPGWESCSCLLYRKRCALSHWAWMGSAAAGSASNPTCRASGMTWPPTGRLGWEVTSRTPGPGRTEREVAAIAAWVRASRLGVAEHVFSKPPVAATPTPTTC